jgi:hypothetical protein
MIFLGLVLLILLIIALSRWFKKSPVNGKLADVKRLVVSAMKCLLSVSAMVILRFVILPYFNLLPHGYVDGDKGYRIWVSVTPASYLIYLAILVPRFYLLFLYQEAIRKLIGKKETFEQDIDGSKIDPAFGALRVAVVLLAQLSIAAQPRQRSLNHPALWHYGKANLIGRLGHDLNTTREILIDPLDKHLLVALVDTQDFQEPEHVSMLVQKPDPAFALTDIGSVNQHTQHKAVRVNNQLPLATLDIFSRLVTPIASSFGGLDALTINHCYTQFQRALNLNSYSPPTLDLIGNKAAMV